MIDEVFENLVGQFTDPFTFYRELIQNSIDAGSNRVDITVGWSDDQGPDGCVVVEVTDDGEGMNRQIIDNQLTRLFASSKEDDLTKIGKFGIGFVSVFAIGPDMVLVDTGRAGEYWRIVFDGTTKFECLSLQSPVEGTRIRVYKRMLDTELEGFVSRSRETIKLWCRFSDSPVFFQGEQINEPLAVDSPCVVRHERTGTELVCGLTAESPPSFGMYNRGLTLREGHELFFPGVTFRLKSRYLEHTLTRDNVIRDKQYEKALQIVGSVVKNELCEHFFAMVVRLHEAGRTEDLDNLMHHSASFLGNWRKGLKRPFHKRPLFPTLHGGCVSISEIRWSAFREGAVYLDAAPNAVTVALEKQGVPVIASPCPDGGVASALQAVTGCPPRVASASVAAPPLLDEPAEEIRGVQDALLDILSQGKRGIASVRLAGFDYEGSCVKTLPCLVQAADGDPVRLFRRSYWRGIKLGPGVLLLNAHHPLVRRALETSARAPLLSAFVLAKAALLQDGLPGDLEARLVGRFVRSVLRT